MAHKLQFVPLPNVEAAIVTLLENDPDSNLTKWTFTPSTTRVGYDDPDTQTWVQVTRVGGKPTWPVPDRALIQFDVYSPNKADAQNLAQAIRAVVYVFSGSQIAADTVLCGCADYHGLAFLPDAQGVSRYVFGLQVFAKPVAANLGPVVSNGG